ncbi:MAG TPA: ATP-binding cassette domain-containing protein [Candidatus Sumerlaeota bacterium]|nr:ATP-binding cassette domain-containing protein [Candidatus Sumerlaeota bacterium]HOR27754.1 ATP-binding cassette domain-containing protein [Candidatus Sumerlaeota bacterium]HPK01362.1 ATP-binding cassette domain-containing protein [Candidatus Sumerlaeota bacterium]
MNVIEAYGLTRYYRTQRGVRDLDLAVPEGCVLGLLGENGCGKTTTIKLAVGALSQWLLKDRSNSRRAIQEIGVPRKNQDRHGPMSRGVSASKSCWQPKDFDIN